MTAPAVVVGVNATARADLAVEWALAEAVSRDAPLRVVCAYPGHILFPQAAARPGPSDPETAPGQAAAEELIAKHLAALHLAAPDMPIDGRTIHGEPAEVLLSQSQDASVIVVGSRRLKAFGSVVLGSVSTAVAAHSHCPVVVVRSAAARPAQDSKVVVGIDDSEACDTVLGFAFDYANRHGLGLDAVVCVPTDPLRETPPDHESEFDDPAGRWLSEVLSGWRERYPEVAAAGVVVCDNAIEGLVQASMGHHLLVVGTHGSSPLAGTLLGSTSLGVVHHANCPVAIVALGGATAR